MSIGSNPLDALYEEQSMFKIKPLEALTRAVDRVKEYEEFYESSITLLKTSCAHPHTYEWHGSNLKPEEFFHLVKLHTLTTVGENKDNPTVVNFLEAIDTMIEAYANSPLYDPYNRFKNLRA